MKVKLNDLLDALEMVSSEKDCYYNPETSEIFLSNIGEFGEYSEDELEDLLNKSIILPTQYDIHEYSIMEDFVETISDTRLQNQLYIALNGRGAFRRFKDTCINYEIINDWYKYRDERYKKIAIDWCTKNNIEIEE